MSKECPSCHRECSEVLECVDCGRMFCIWCGNWLPPFPARCPDCEGLFMGRGEKVSRDDDDHDDSRENYNSSPNGSSDFDYGGSPHIGELLVPIGIIAVLLIIGAMASSRPKVYENQPPAPTYTQSPPSTQQTDNVRHEENQNQSNPYCGAATKMAWYYEEFCRNPELAALSKQVERLDSIFFMTGSSQPLNSLTWQMNVDRTCKEASSPTDCLRSALENRSQLLQAKISEELATNRPGIFKDDARKHWEQYKNEKGIHEERAVSDPTQNQVEQVIQEQQPSQVVIRIFNQNCWPTNVYMNDQLVSTVPANTNQDLMVTMGTYIIRGCDSTNTCTQSKPIIINGPGAYYTILQNNNCNSGNVYGNNLLTPPPVPQIR